jgi:hypothetical protein
MSHFAQINDDNFVTQVIVAEQDFINSGAVGDPSRWIQTSYNTFAGEHKNGGTPLRKNYAGIGYKYDSERDAFIPPKPYDSWTLNEDTCQWTPPSPYPNDGKFYQWNEQGLLWEEFTAS